MTEPVGRSETTDMGQSEAIAEFTLADLERGKLPPHTSIHEPHWYATIVESGCLLCGAGGREQRVRMPGQAPTDPAQRYVVWEHDWACGSHFL